MSGAGPFNPPGRLSESLKYHGEEKGFLGSDPETKNASEPDSRIENLADW